MKNSPTIRVIQSNPSKNFCLSDRPYPIVVVLDFALFLHLPHLRHGCTVGTAEDPPPEERNPTRLTPSGVAATSTEGYFETSAYNSRLASVSRSLYNVTEIVTGRVGRIRLQSDFNPVLSK